jgi:hypothetical protein
MLNLRRQGGTTESDSPMLPILLDANRWTVDSEPKAWARIGAAYRASKSRIDTAVMLTCLDFLSQS